MNDVQRVLIVNLIKLRKDRGLTQGELGEQVHYSDKSISKWENGDTCPNIEAIYTLAGFYGVGVDDLLNPAFDPAQPEEDSALRRKRVYSKAVITLLAVSCVWTIAVLLFLSLSAMSVRSWLVFIDAVPASCITVLVFNSLWGNRRYNYLIISLLLWSLLTAVYLHILPVNFWALYILGIPIQAATVLWSQLKVTQRKPRRKSKAGTP